MVFPPIHAAIVSSTSHFLILYCSNFCSSRSIWRYLSPVVLMAVTPNQPGTFHISFSVFIASSSSFIGSSQNIFIPT